MEFSHLGLTPHLNVANLLFFVNYFCKNILTAIFQLKIFFVKKIYFFDKNIFAKNIFGKGTSLSIPCPCPIIHPLHTTPTPVIWSWGGGRNKRTHGLDGAMVVPFIYIDIHEGCKFFNCDQCNKKFTAQSNLYRHIKNMH